MLKFFRKHYILTIFLLMPFFLYGYYYFNYVIYDDDRFDHRHYPIPPLTEKWTKTIEYKTLPHVKFSKCFVISFNGHQLSDNVNKMFGKDFVNEIFKFRGHTFVATYYDEVYTKKYLLHHTEDLTEEEFYKEAKEKPHFWLKIYQNDVLLKTLELYFTNFESSSEVKIGDRELSAPGIIGRPGHKQGYCHDFAEDTLYKLEIINDQIIPEFHDVEVFFTLRPVLYKA